MGDDSTLAPVRPNFTAAADATRCDIESWSARIAKLSFKIGH